MPSAESGAAAVRVAAALALTPLQLADTSRLSAALFRQVHHLDGAFEKIGDGCGEGVVVIAGDHVAGARYVGGLGVGN